MIFILLALPSFSLYFWHVDFETINNALLPKGLSFEWGGHRLGYNSREINMAPSIAPGFRKAFRRWAFRFPNVQNGV